MNTTPQYPDPPRNQDPMTKDTTEGWDGRPDGPDTCSCKRPCPDTRYPGFCECGDQLPADYEPEEMDPRTDAAMYRDAKLDGDL